MTYATTYDLCAGPCGRLFASEPMANAWGMMANYTVIKGQKYCLDCTAKILADHGIIPEVKIVQANPVPAAPPKLTWWQRLFR